MRHHVRVTALRRLVRAALLATALLAGAAEAAPAATPTPATGGAAGPAAAAVPEALEVQRLPTLPADPAAAAWAALPALTVPAAPQRSIRLHDRAANAALASGGPRSLSVRAATDGVALAVLVEWADATEDLAPPDATDRYGDGAALQLPLRFGPGQRLPYVGMGDEGQPVAVLLARATAAGAQARTTTGAGFGTLARTDLGPLTVALRYDRQRQAWRALFVRPLAAAGLDLRQGLVPFALATWDGSRQERGGNKALTGWRFLRLPGQPLDAGYAAEQAFGRGPGDLGDAVRGRGLFEESCTACHAAAGHQGAAPGLAPDLSAIGVIATPGYLRASLLRPSEVIVPNPNPRQHQDRTAARDARGAWPDDEAFTWFAREADGRTVSTMPDYAALPPQDLADLLAYLVTMGGAPPARRTP